FRLFDYILGIEKTSGNLGFMKCEFGTRMGTCLEPFRLRDRRLGTGIIGIDELDIGLRLGRELNAGIDELDIEMAKVETWALRNGRIGTGIIDGQAWYWNDQRLGRSGTGLGNLGFIRSDLVRLHNGRLGTRMIQIDVYRSWLRNKYWLDVLSNFIVYERKLAPASVLEISTGKRLSSGY
ncbi:4224_t:CDS:2, partial [Gigaspora rosea]